MIFSGATGPQVTKFHDFSWFLHSDTNSSPCSQFYPPGQTLIGSSTYQVSIWYQYYRAGMIISAATGPIVTKFHGFYSFSTLTPILAHVASLIHQERLLSGPAHTQSQFGTTIIGLP